MLRRRTTLGPKNGPPTSSRLERLPRKDLETALETALLEATALFDSLRKPDTERPWALAQMETHLQVAKEAASILSRSASLTST